MVRNREHYGANTKDFKSHMKNMLKPDTEATRLEQRAIADMYGLDIMIYKSDSSKVPHRV